MPKLHHYHAGAKVSLDVTPPDWQFSRARIAAVVVPLMAAFDGLVCSIHFDVKTIKVEAPASKDHEIEFYVKCRDNAVAAATAALADVSIRD